MADRYDTTCDPEDEYYPGTSVLHNLEDIRDPEKLLKRATELQLAAYEAIFSLFDESLTPDLPFFVLSAPHDVQPSVCVGRSSAHSGYCQRWHPVLSTQNINHMMNAIFAELERERWLEGLDLNTFVERAAYYISEINAVHPFREGNGRAIRFYIDVLSA